MQRAKQADPLSPLWAAWHGDLHWSVGDYDAAIAEHKKPLELDPDFAWSFYTLGIAYATKGMDAEARAANQRAVAANPAWGWVHAHTHARAGRAAEARKAAADLERQAKPDALNLALVYSVLGDKAAAFRWLEIAYEQRDPFVPWYVGASP